MKKMTPHFFRRQEKRLVYYKRMEAVGFNIDLLTIGTLIRNHGPKGIIIKASEIG